MISTMCKENQLLGFYTLYLRSPGDENLFLERSFKITKHLDHSNWVWRDSLRSLIPYTIEKISTLPFKKIGLIRVFITENTFFPTHYDYDPKYPIDITKSLGISLVPLTGGVPLKIWSGVDKQIKEVHGHAHIFRDSQPHGVPFTDQTRITIRIFGDIDYNGLEKLIDNESIIY
jgi:hypothetical protein